MRQDGEQTAEIEVGGETLTLLAGRAALWARTKTLLVADAHFGKTASFRSFGVPAPEGVTGRDLERLGDMVDATGAERIVFLGDLLHSRRGRADGTMETIGAWLGARSSLETVLVRGNHDLSAGDPPSDWSMRCAEAPLVESGLALRHDPEETDGAYTVCGHLHPVAGLRGTGGAHGRAACFWFGARIGVLPAFGGFTGGMKIRPTRGDRVFLVGPGEVREAALAGAGAATRRAADRGPASKPIRT